MNFQYHGEWSIPENELQHGNFLANPVFYNKVFPLLKDIGYKTVAFDTGFAFTELHDVDYFLSPFIRLNPVEEFLLGSTPLRVITNFIDLKLPINNYKTHLTRLRHTVSELKTVNSIPGHKVIFAHLLLPHPPFIFTQDGAYVEPKHPFGIFDGDDYLGSTEEYYNGYREQVQFTSTLVLDFVDQILADSDIPPIILIQGDHGPGMNHDWDGAEKSCLFERTSILNALFLPGVEKEQLYPQLSPVNSFRIIFNSYFGTDLEILPDLSYYTSLVNIENIVDVTEQRDSMINCENPHPNHAVEVYTVQKKD